MAYQNVGQCKFFVDHGLWLNSLGLFSPPDVISSMMGLNPTNIIEPTGGFSMYYYVPRYAPITSRPVMWLVPQLEHTIGASLKAVGLSIPRVLSILPFLQAVSIILSNRTDFCSDIIYQLLFLVSFLT